MDNRVNHEVDWKASQPSIFLMKLAIHHFPRSEGSYVAFPSLSELIIEDCNKEILRSIVRLTSLITPRTMGMPELMHLGKRIVQFPRTIRILVISNCIGLTSLWQKGYGL